MANGLVVRGAANSPRDPAGRSADRGRNVIQPQEIVPQGVPRDADAGNWVPRADAPPPSPVFAQQLQVPNRVQNERGAERLVGNIQNVAPNFAELLANMGMGALDPNLAALANAESIEVARQRNEEEIWGANGLINRLGGQINNQDQQSARAAIQGLLNSNDPFYDRMMRQIQDQYGLQSRDALTAAAQRFGAQGRNFSDFNRAMLAQQQRGAMSQAINQNEMARYAAAQQAREKASQLFMGLSADMRAQLEQYAQYIAAFPHTTPSFEAFIFPPEFDRDDPLNVLGMEDPNRSRGGLPYAVDADTLEANRVGAGPNAGPEAAQFNPDRAPHRDQMGNVIAAENDAEMRAAWDRGECVMTVSGPRRHIGYGQSRACVL